MKQLVELTVIEQGPQEAIYHLTLIVDGISHEFTATYTNSDIAATIGFDNANQLLSLLASENDRAYWRLIFAIRSLYRTGTTVDLPYDLDAKSSHRTLNINSKTSEDAANKN